MVDQEVIDSQLKADRFPFPSEGDITLRVRNANYTLGPVMLHVGMNPGAVIPAHLHKGMAEALYVAEGDFTNEGKQYQAGTSLHFKAGKAHGPHSTNASFKNSLASRLCDRILLARATRLAPQDQRECE
jgi:quercetin dioxygenase-like cupin family protein